MIKTYDAEYYDIAVIGGGAAGLMAAFAAAEGGNEVTIFEKISVLPVRS